MGSPCSEAVSLSKRTTSISSASSGMVERTKVSVEMITTVIDVNAHICENRQSTLFSDDHLMEKPPSNKLLLRKKSVSDENGHILSRGLLCGIV